MFPRHLIPLALTVLVVSARAEAPPPESHKIDDLKPLVATAAKADKVILHEGLPHPRWEKKDLEAEKAAKKTIEIAGWAFYAEPLALKDGDAKKLTDVLGNEKSFSEFRGEKKCGGFHPDYAVEWRVGKDVYYVLICFGCGEAKVYGAGKAVRADFGAGDLGKLLKGYRKNRPESKE